MAHRLKMAMIHAIEELLRRGWSHRRIARELGVHRETVSRYDRVRRSKPAISTPGSDPPLESGRKSHCEPFREVIQLKIDQGLTAQRIFQDLRTDTGFTGSYSSVKRFVRRLGKVSPLPFRRIEVSPGEEAQVDFGRGPWVVEDGHKHRTHILRIALSHSRKGYSEAIYRQTTDGFIGCLENSFRHFRGVPAILVIDNLKAAVTRADWFEPELNPKIVSFARHYGIAILPTRPASPREKGKIERPYRYVRQDFFLGRAFRDMDDLNSQLSEWLDGVANRRLHGTTRRLVHEAFAEEKATLQPLPALEFGTVLRMERRISRDGMVSVDGNLYSVPDTTRRRVVEVQVTAREIFILDGGNLVAVHPVLEGSGQRRVSPGHRIWPPPGNTATGRKKGQVGPLGIPGQQVPRRALAVYEMVAGILAQNGRGRL